MEIKAVCAAFFSATGTTKKIVWEIAKEIAVELKISLREFDFTLPQARRNPPVFSENEIVVFGTPVYAGRVPNVLLPYLAAIEGNGAVAVPVVVYGNRDFDDALIELRDILLKGGLKPLAAAAFVGEHSFSDRLAKGRPDAEDLRLACGFAEQAVQKLRDGRQAEELFVKGVPQPYRGYYQPRDRKGSPVDIRKVKPLTGKECDACGLCVKLCPMGSISSGDVSSLTGICIKCGACIKGCPRHAKYYDDEGYLYHRHELEEGLKRRAQPELFL